jgi:hypothetical protein
MKDLVLLIFSTMVAMVGYTIHGSIFWAVVDFVFSPIAIIKWLICHEITFAIIQQTFAFLF